MQETKEGADPTDVNSPCVFPTNSAADFAGSAPDTPAARRPRKKSFFHIGYAPVFRQKMVTVARVAVVTLSTLKPRMAGAATLPEIAVVQPVNVVSTEAIVLETVGFAAAVMVSATVGLALAE